MSNQRMLKELYVRAKSPSVTPQRDGRYHLIVRGAEGEEIELLIEPCWEETVQLLWEGAPLFIGRGEAMASDQYVVGADSRFILSPGLLLEATALSTALECPRKHLANRASPPEPPGYNGVIGSLAHQLFARLVESKGEINLAKEAKEIIKRNHTLLAALRYPPSEEGLAMRLCPLIESVKGWLTELVEAHPGFDIRTERYLLSHRLGLKGRVDTLMVNPASASAVVVDFKTGRACGDHPHPDHRAQMVVYSLLVEEALLKGQQKTEAWVLYAGEPSYFPYRKVEWHSGHTCQLLNLRNKLVAIDLGRYHPSPVQQREVCSRCFSRQGCLRLWQSIDAHQQPDSPPPPFFTLLSEEQRIAPPVETSAQERLLLHFQSVRAEREHLAELSGELHLGKLEPKFKRELVIEQFKLTGKKKAGGWTELTFSCLNETQAEPGDLVLLVPSAAGKRGTARGKVKAVSGTTLQLMVQDEVEDPAWGEPPLQKIDLEQMERALFVGYLFKGEKVEGVSLSGEHSTLSRKEEWLNQSQREAVERALSADAPLVVWGAPGTGKTVVLALIIRELAQRGRRVLFSALTHQGVDHLLQKLKELGWEGFLRIGTPLAVNKTLHSYLLDPYLAGLSTRQLRERLLEVPVIASTMGTAASNPLIHSQRFDVAVVDEAGQLSEPATLIPLNRSERFLLAGDPFSLPPVVRSSAARRNRLHCSMMERLIASDSHRNRTLFFSVQYRMNREIIAFSNSQFYQRKMVADPSVADLRLHLPSPEIISPEIFPIIDPDSPMVFANLPAEVGAENHNPEEVEAVSQTVRGLLQGGIRGNEIGVIAPYRVQVDYLRKRIVSLGSQFPTIEGITIDTVEKFQGEEREVVIISFTNTSKEGFGRCWDINHGGRHRMNVALTRAKKKLILVGDSRLLEREPFYRRLLEHCRVVSAKI
ncbi:hypothetical protein CEE39_04455 [bacterium (candidate division B38) B3_B38]|nr:MAG: hypothetical protein CEE39_04455 [bacterium (candidate division B38) B3_B38]